jgi:hypothetical protein
MKNVLRLTKLHICRHKAFKIILAAEILFIIVGIAGLFGKNATYEYGVNEAAAGAGIRTADGIFIDESMTIPESGEVVDFTEISLPAGTYRVQLKYDTDTDALNNCYVSDDSMAGRMLRTNGAQLFSGLESTDYDMMLLENTSKLAVHVYYNGSGSLLVRGMTIQRNNLLERCILFCILLLCTVINILYLYREYDRVYHIPVKNKTVTFILGIGIILAVAPLLSDAMPAGGDLVYHLMRVEGIKDGILAGQFPIRISPEWQQGYGYASPIFYGETILYIAAIFRLIGFTVEASYKMFMIVISAATVLISYISFKNILKNDYAGVFCSLLYSTSVYRMYKAYFCGSWGECLGIMLLPVIALGFYKVFTEDIHEKKYCKNWVVLTAGFTLLLQSHLLTCEMVGLFTIILCIIFWKKVFRKETFIVLAKTVIYTILLSAWFIVPFADYMLTGDFVIKHTSARTIQYRGLFPVHLLMTFFTDGGNVFFDTEGMADSAPMGVGMILIVPALILLYLFLSGKAGKLEKNIKGLAIVTLAFSCLAMLMSLNIFPWDRIQQINQITATLVSSIQFPNRFLTIANVCLTVVAGITAKYVLEQDNMRLKSAYFAGMLALFVMCNIYLLEQCFEMGGFVRIYNSEGMGTGYISGAEYLPTGTDAGKLMYHAPVCSGALEYSDYEKQSLGAVVNLTNNGTDTETAAFPLLYYKGYHAYTTDTLQELYCYSGENCEVTVEIPGNFSGGVQVKFESPIYWRIAELVTLITFLAMIVCGMYNTKRKSKKETIDTINISVGEVSPE